MCLFIRILRAQRVLGRGQENCVRALVSVEADESHKPANVGSHMQAPATALGHCGKILGQL